MKKFKQFFWLIPLVIMFMANIGWGQPILTDDFSYTAGTLLTANGWTNHSGTSNFIPVTSGGLSYAGFVGSGIGNAASLTTTGEDVNRTFTNQTSGSVYASFMVNVSASQVTGDYFLHFIQSPTTSNVFVAKVFVKKDPTLATFAFGVSKRNNSATATFTGYNYTINTTYLLIVKYTFNTGSTTDDICYLFVNPIINGSEPVPDLTSAVETSTDATNIDMIALRQGTAAAAPTLWVDGIRVGTTWVSVVPAAGTPSISVNPSSLPAFTTTINNPSASQTYTVSGSDLGITDLVITAPAHFELRENGIGSYGSSLSFTPVGGTVTQKTIEVRLKSEASPGKYTSVITNTSGATTQDVTVAGGINTPYYNSPGADLDNVANWGTDPSGTGTPPPDFVSDNQEFIIKNGTTATIAAGWTVSGLYSKVVLGDGVNAINYTVPSGFAFTGAIDVSANATLTLQNSTLPTFGTIDPGSTISYEQGVSTVIQAKIYGNLTAKGSTKTFASGNTTVLGNLVADNVTDFDGSASPFSTVNLAGNFTLQNGTAFNPLVTNRLTLVCNGSSVQTLTGNNSDFKLFRITLQNASGLVLSNTGGTSNLVLGNTSGGGYTLTTGDLTVNNNSISFYQYGKAAIFGTGSLVCSPNSNLAFSGNGTTNIGTLILKTGNETINNLTIDITGGGTNKTVTLGSNLIVNGTLNMSTNTAGKIALGTFNLTLGSSASITGLSDSNYVVTNGTGELKRNISNNDTYVTFPVGPTITSYNPVNIKLDVASTPDVFGITVSNTITNPANKPTEVIIKEWNISEGTPGGSNATIQYSFSTGDFGAAFNPALVPNVYDIGDYNAGYSVYSGSISGPVIGFYTITSTQLISSFSPFIVGNYGSVTGAIPLNLGLTAMLSGYCNGTTMNYTKNVTVELHDAASPYNLIESKVVTLSTSGLANPLFTIATNGTPYWIVIKSNNGLETWSAATQTFTGSTLSYDFTDFATKAYGSNMLLVGTKWCIISGDVDQDGAVGALDRSACWNDRNLVGVYATDLDGDGAVGALDRSICWNNRNAALQKPPIIPDKGLKQDNKGDKNSTKGTYDLRLDGKNAKKVDKTR